MRLGDGCNGFDLVVLVDVGRSDRARWFHELTAEIDEGSGGGRCVLHSSPAPGRPIEDGPDQGETAPFSGQSSDDLYPPAGLPEGALDEVGVADALPVLIGEPQV